MQRTRRRLSLSAGLILVLALLGASLAPIIARGPALAASPGLDLRPGSGQPGTVIAARGARFPANADGQLVWSVDGSLLGSFRTKGNGSFRSSFTIPFVPSGAYPVVAVVGDTTAEGMIQVDALPDPTPTPAPPTPTLTPAPTATSTISVATATFLPATATATASPTVTMTPTPTTTSNQSVVPFSDGFESGNLAAWENGSGLVVQSTMVDDGAYAARAVSAGRSAYVRRSLSSAQPELFYRTRFQIVSHGSGTIHLLKLRSATDASLVSLFVLSDGRLGYLNDVVGGSLTSAIVVSHSAWHEVEIHVKIAGAASLIEVWYDGGLVTELSRADNFGTNAVGRVQLGDHSSGKTYDVAFDNAAYAATFIPPFVASEGSGNPSPTPTATPGSGPTATPISASTVPSTPTPAVPPTDTTVFSDGFESGNLSAWTSANRLTVQQDYVGSGNYAVRATARGNGAVDARVTLGSTYAELYFRVRFVVLSQGGTTLYLQKLRDANDTSLLSVYVDSTGRLGTRNHVTSRSTSSATIVSQGVWHELQVRVRVNGAESEATVWLDGARVDALHRTENLGTDPVGRIQIGDNDSGHIFDAVIDDVVVGTGYIWPSAQIPPPVPTNSPTPVPSATSTASPGSTPGSILGGDVTLPIRAAFYYPWFPGAWDQGVYPFTNYTPSLGFYDGGDRTVIAQHIAAMQYGNIQAGIASWWGQGTREDARIPALLDAAAGTGFKWAIYYEDEGFADPSVSDLQADLEYIRSNFAADPSYMRINGRFVIFVYADNADACGMVERWNQANTVNAYVVLKVFSGYRNCVNQPDGWHQYAPAAAADNQAGHSYSISPGFWLKGEGIRLERDLARWQQNVREMVASGAPFQLVTTFNEWGESTSVESAKEWESGSGYGAYLDVLHDNGAGPLPGSTPTPNASPPPTGASFTFAVGGDMGATSATDASFAAVADSDAAFLLALGDLSYSNLVPEAAWCNRVLSYLGDGFPVQLIVGNHEDDDRVDGHIGNFAACLPDRMGSTGAYAAEYWFDYNGLARIIMIGAGNDVNGVAYDYTAGSARLAWVAAAIDDARAKGIRWVIVGMHKVCISAGNKPCEVGEALMDLLIEKRVDLVLSGHEHDYQRSKQLACANSGSYTASCVADTGNDGRYTQGAGTVWVINGLFGGGGMTSINTSDSEAGYFAAWLGGNSPNAGRGFGLVTVTATSLSYSFVGSTTSYGDTFIIGAG